MMQFLHNLSFSFIYKRLDIDMPGKHAISCAVYLLFDTIS